jgi:hypothetical protein
MHINCKNHVDAKTMLLGDAMMSDAGRLNEALAN